MSGLRRTLGPLQALTLSIAVIAPTLAMAFNVTLAAGAAGRAAPLAFLVGGAAVALVGLSFVAFARRIASAGSAATYVAAAFGGRWGFLAGWTMLLAYQAFLASATALAGGFTQTALGHLGLGHFGVDLPEPWLALAIACGAGVIGLGGREIGRVAALMLVIEVGAVAAMLVLAATILAEAPLSWAPFRPDPARGVAGVGYGVVFAVLSFAGFEGAAAVAEETRDPHRAIPLAIVGSVAATTLLYALVSYAQVVGFGLDRVGELARDLAPLDTLSARYVAPAYGVFLDLAAGISSLACALGTASAGARILFSLGRGGFGARLGLGAVDPRHGAPRASVRAIGALNLAGLLTAGAWAGFQAYAEACATVATMALIPVYAAVALAQARDAAGGGRRWWCAAGLIGAALLAWPLLATLYPAPPWPGLLWPCLVAAWIAAGALLARARPAGGGPGA